ncbi:hypothetical protein, partial [Nonomuraea sp. NPDC001023]
MVLSMVGRARPAQSPREQPEKGTVGTQHVAVDGARRAEQPHRDAVPPCAQTSSPAGGRSCGR